MKDDLSAFDDRFPSTPDEALDAYDAWEAREEAENEAADRWYDEHGSTE